MTSPSLAFEASSTLIASDPAGTYRLSPALVLTPIERAPGAAILATSSTTTVYAVAKDDSFKVPTIYVVGKSAAAVGTLPALPTSIAVDATHLYAVIGSQIHRVSLVGASVDVLTVDASELRHLAVDGTCLYVWGTAANDGPAKLYTRPKTP